VEEAGFTLVAAGDGSSGLTAYERIAPDLIILDLMLPGMDGYEVCKRIRAQGHTPILMLTARRTEDDRVMGLDLGADDYLTKPFSPRELVSRVRAILRRTSLQAAESEPARMEYPGLTIIPSARRVEVDGRAVELTAKEFDVLLTLARAPDQVMARETLLSKVWGFDYLGDSRTVDVHIGTLRKKVEHDPAHPRFIKTVWTVGYKFDPSGAEGDS
ncbi:MAG TPA: response regulator transcription factor, partial [Ktedonobacterales bacterium]